MRPSPRPPDASDRVMTAAVPLRGVITLYALVGDAFA
jgi:hypothetical protein